VPESSSLLQAVIQNNKGPGFDNMKGFNAHLQQKPAGASLFGAGGGGLFGKYKFGDAKKDE
jgi:hypothetical protein